MLDNDPMRQLFRDHSRHWRDFRYVYPVISRRSHGLSIGVNLNPDQACNFDCVYCSVDRAHPPEVTHVDLSTLEHELDDLLTRHMRLFDEPPFRHVVPDFRRLNDIAFSGDGEPTASPLFPAAARLVARCRAAHGLDAVRVVVITNACFLDRPEVEETLSFLDAHGGEVWAKLDAGTEEHFRRVNRPHLPLDRVLANILRCGQERPIIIQSMFIRVDGTGPDPSEIDAYCDRLRRLRDDGARTKLVQVYTIARPTADGNVTALPATDLHEIATRVRALGLAAEAFA